MSCGVGRRHSSDLPLLWLWRGPEDPWEPPNAAGAALKGRKDTHTQKLNAGVSIVVQQKQI